MSKKDGKDVFKFRDSRDKLIDLLIDDKNRLFMRNKQLEKDIAVLKNQLKYQRRRYKDLMKRNREIVNELLEESVNKKSSA